jgi:hypothetical protein
MAQNAHHGVPAALAGMAWRKSTYSGCLGNCVEVATLYGGEVALRNSRHPSGPKLIFSRTEMAAFLAGVKDDKFDDVVC